MLIDDVDIRTLPLRSVRSAVAMIPQDPLLFCGTMRSNLDPFSEKTDVELWTALDKAQYCFIISQIKLHVAVADLLNLYFLYIPFHRHFSMGDYIRTLPAKLNSEVLVSLFVLAIACI